MSDPLAREGFFEGKRGAKGKGTAFGAGLSVSLRLFGVKDLDAKFKKLPDRLQKKILRQSMRIAAKDVKAAVKAAVPKDTGRLRRGIEIKSIKRSRSLVGVIVRTKTREHFGISADSKWYYPAIIEYGFVRHGITYQPRSYLRATVDRLRAASVKRIGANIRTKLTAVAKKP